MKRNWSLVMTLSVLLFFSRCRVNDIGCWQAFDPLGYDVPGLVLCDMSQAEAEDRYPHYWFYRAGEQKYCWKQVIGSQSAYAWGIPESMVARYRQENGAYQFEKIDCTVFCTLEWQEKHFGKATGQYAPTRIFTETLLSSDSCRNLAVGKVVVLRETSDSLVTRELLRKYP